MLCERGSSFGYDNLVVDMLGFPEPCAKRRVAVRSSLMSLIACNAATRAAKRPRPSRTSVRTARAGLATGVAGLFSNRMKTRIRHAATVRAHCRSLLLEPFLSR